MLIICRLKKTFKKLPCQQNPNLLLIVLLPTVVNILQWFDQLTWPLQRAFSTFNLVLSPFFLSAFRYLVIFKPNRQCTGTLAFTASMENEIAFFYFILFHHELLIHANSSSSLHYCLLFCVCMQIFCFFFWHYLWPVCCFSSPSPRFRD